MSFQRVVTHNDFDGVVCAAICSHIYGMENLFFTGPRDVASARFPITVQDIVCDLPYPLECGMWFDHHPGNLEDVKLRGIAPESIPGRFSPDPSCARTVFDHFSQEWELEVHLQDTVAEADHIDSFNYKTIEEWREPTPGKNIDASIKSDFEDNRERVRYLKRVALWIRDYPLVEIERFKEVVERRLNYEEKEKRSTEIVRESTVFVPEDTEKVVPVVDLTRYRVRPNVIRHMAYMEYPQAQAVILVANPMIDGRKSTNLSLSMSLSLVLNNFKHAKDIGEIMRTLNIGDGHAGAGAGAVDCQGKEEMLRAKEKLLSDIVGIFLKQPLDKGEAQS
jgi:hypothetical protein